MVVCLCVFRAGGASDGSGRDVVRRYKDSRELSPLFCLETSCLLVEVAWQVYYDPTKMDLTDTIAPGKQDLSYLGLTLVVRCPRSCLHPARPRGEPYQKGGSRNTTEFDWPEMLVVRRVCRYGWTAPLVPARSPGGNFCARSRPPSPSPVHAG